MMDRPSLVEMALRLGAAGPAGNAKVLLGMRMGMRMAETERLFHSPAHSPPLRSEGGSLLAARWGGCPIYAMPDLCLPFFVGSADR